MESLSQLIYQCAILLYGFALNVAALFNRRAKLWVQGRKHQQEKLNNLQLQGKKIWFHCASLGEFEQARPVIEKVKREIPGCSIILTFFSPSGYEVRKNYEMADAVLYLPLDTPANARHFIAQVKPDIALFVKYEFWYNYLTALQAAHIPVILFSAVFRKEQIFFKGYGGLFRKMLRAFNIILVQDEPSAQLLNTIHIASQVNFDTRFDRVNDVRNSNTPHPLLQKFKTASKVFIAGSTWQKDEEILLQLINEDVLKEYKYIIAPHNINKDNLISLQERIKVKTALLSQLTDKTAQAADVILVDSIGQLPRLYVAADMAYVGGGFGVSVHNVLEPAVYGMPVLFGPAFHKSLEAKELLTQQAAFCISSYTELKATLEKLVSNIEMFQTAKKNSAQYVREHLGGTEKVFQTIKTLAG